MAKHLTYDDRLEIEAYLKENHSLSEISRKLNRHKSTRSTTEKRAVMDVIIMHVSIGLIMTLVSYAKETNVYILVQVPSKV